MAKDKIGPCFAVVNPASSNGRTGKLWPKLRSMLAQSGLTCKSELTSKPGDATNITRQALEQGFDTIISVGGDGTHNEVANGFFSPKGQNLFPNAALLCVTSGTGGDFRKSLGFPSGPWIPLQRLANPTKQQIDVGKFNYLDHYGKQQTRIFINILSFGLGGLVDEKVNSTTKAFGGKISFLLGTLRAMVNYSNKTVTLTLDSKPTYQGKTVLVAVANGKYFGGGMKIAPHANLTDGLFDVVVLGDMNKLQLLKLSKSIYFGKHIQDKKVSIYQAKEVVAESEERVLLDVDGEQLGSLPIQVSILPQALTILK